MEKDEKNAKEEFLVAQRMLSHVRNCISIAVANNDMIEIKVANELLHSAQQRYEKASEHRKELKKICVSIGLKGRKAMTQLLKEVKGAKLTNFK